MSHAAEASSPLQVVVENDVPARRLALARRHVESAISHINDVAQARVPPDSRDASAADELRLIVRALADIREALRASDWPVPRLDTDARLNPLEDPAS